MVEVIKMVVVVVVEVVIVMVSPLTTKEMEIRWSL